MPRLSIWNNGKKGNDYKFLDNTIREQFLVGGTAVFVHKYLGVTDVNGEANPEVEGGEMQVQDMLFLENRDRRYAKDVIELRGVYNMQDSEFDLKQFGLFLENDVIFIHVHMNDMIAQIGRKLMAGDIVELPHLRDDHLLNADAPSINKFYSVEDASRASEGFSPTWFPHIWRLKCKPLTDSQQYDNVLDKGAVNTLGLPMDQKLRDIMSNVGIELGINEAVVEEAKVHVSARNFETRQFYVVPGDHKTSQFPWIFAGDGVPPNDAQMVGNGNIFPQDPKIGDFFLRTDYDPHVLFQREDKKWTRVEIDYRQQDWSMAHRLLKSFINNREQTSIPATNTEAAKTFDEKQPLSASIKPRADF